MFVNEMTFSRCLIVLIATATVSSFAPSMATKWRSDGAYGHRQDYQVPPLLVAPMRDSGIDDPMENWMPKSRTITIDSFFQRPHEKQPIQTFVSTLGSGILATSMIAGSLLFASPDPAAAMTITSIPKQPTRALQSTTTTLSSSSSALSDSSLTISDLLSPNELRIQPKYLDMAQDLKEEVKFRAKKAQEKSAEIAKEAIEKQQAEADKRAAKLKEYDDMFDQSEKERNEYFSSRIISRDSYLQNLKEQQGTQDRSEHNKIMTALAPDASPVEELKYKLEKNIEEENRLKTALAENGMKDPNDRDTKIERTLLNISIKKVERQTSKLRKDIALEESLESIRLERQAEIRVYQERADIREKEKQEQIEKIRLAKERERDAFLELRARKREEAEELKFANAQTIFERKFDELDRFEERKGILSSRAKKEDAAKIKRFREELNNLAVEGSKTDGVGK